MNIGYVGLGAMGGALASHLVRKHTLSGQTAFKYSGGEDRMDGPTRTPLEGTAAR